MNPDSQSGMRARSGDLARADLPPAGPSRWYRYGGMVVRMVGGRLEPMLAGGVPVIARGARKALFPKLPKQLRATWRTELASRSRIDKARERLKDIGIHVPGGQVEQQPAWTDLSKIAQEAT